MSEYGTKEKGKGRKRTANPNPPAPSVIAVSKDLRNASYDV